MSRVGALARGRAFAEEGMVDTCSIRRSTGSTVDDNTGDESETWQSLYVGKCRVQQRTPGAQQQTPGEDVQLMLSLELQLPVTVTGLRVGDEVTITASAHDPDLAGQVLLIRDLFAKTHPTARRVGVTRRTS